MTPIVAITMLVAAFCGLAKRLVGSVVGAFLLAMIGLARLMAPHQASAHHLLLHGLHLLLLFNATYAAFALFAALVL
jgi:hypothetical protein